MIDLGMVSPGVTLNIPFSTYDSNDPSASVTCTGLAVTDIEIFKDGSLVQRSNDAGYAVDTDLDTIVGVHSIQIDLADNTVAGFFSAGSEYIVVVSSITVDAGVVSFVAARFTIGQPGAMWNTNMATRASQTSFTLTKGPAEASALLGCTAIIHDVASEVQFGYGFVTAYDVTTKTVTLAAGPTFTTAQYDNVSFMAPTNVAAWLGTAAATPTVAGVPEVDLTHVMGTILTEGGAGRLAAAIIKLFDVATPVLVASDVMVGTDGANTVVPDAAGVAPTAAEIKTEVEQAGSSLALILADTGTDGVVVAAGSKTGYALSATGADLILKTATFALALADAIWDEPVAGHVGAGSFGKTDADILADTNDLQTNQGAWATATGFATSAALSTHDGKLDTAQTDLDTITGADGVTLATTQGLYAPAKAGANMGLSAGAVTAAVVATDAIDADALAADAVTEIVAGLLGGEVTELAAVPAASPTLEQALGLLFMALRNKVTATASVLTIHNDAGSALGTKGLSDDDTTYTEAELS